VVAAVTVTGFDVETLILLIFGLGFDLSFRAVLKLCSAARQVKDIDWTMFA
jgi:hypothetical protein